MAQLFKPGSNTLAKASIVGAVLLVGGLLFIAEELQKSDYFTGEKIIREQPVQFSHRHHVGDEGIDCRYCHTSVEYSSFAGLPPTKTCMNCHSQIWSNSPYLEPVRASYKTGMPIHWTRVHDLPDFVYFNHSIHVNKGVGCSSCHGRVDMMSLTYQENSLQMEWCINCHRDPAAVLRPKSEIFNMKWEPPANQREVGEKLMKEYKVMGTPMLTDCYTCHR